MEIVTNLMDILENKTLIIEETNTTYSANNPVYGNSRAQGILVIQTVTASLGIVTNLTVIVVFLNHKKLRRKIPNIFIINQVRNISVTFFN